MNDSDELARLGELHQRGVLSDDEFSRAKARVLQGQPEANRPAASGSSLHNLRRSRNDRWLGGVCGGIADFTDVPAWLWRLFFTLLVVCAGSGLLVYLLLWFFVPSEPAMVSGPQRVSA